MPNPFWARVRRYYIAGLFVLAPTALTAWVVWGLFTFFGRITPREKSRFHNQLVSSDQR